MLFTCRVAECDVGFPLLTYCMSKCDVVGAAGYAMRNVDSPDVIPWMVMLATARGRIPHDFVDGTQTAGAIAYLERSSRESVAFLFHVESGDIRDCAGQCLSLLCNDGQDSRSGNEEVIVS